MGKVQSQSETPKLIWGNLDKKQEQELPDNFDPSTNYFIKLWKEKKFDGQLMVVKSTIKYQVYDDLAFDQSFETVVNKKTQAESKPVIQSLGFNYQILHNPNKQEPVV